MKNWNILLKPSKSITINKKKEVNSRSNQPIAPELVRMAGCVLGSKA
jgi:hypothetical protein